MDIKELLLGAALGAGAITLANETKTRVGAVANGTSKNAIKDGALGAACGITTVLAGKESLSHLTNAFYNETFVDMIDTDADPEIPVLDTEVEFDEVPEMEL